MCYKTMFGKKKTNEIKVMHYEGIDGFAADYPVQIELKDGMFCIHRIKPETNVTLPLDRITKFTAMEESRFMQKYKGNAAGTSKGVKKYYLIVDYDKGTLVFWGTGTEYGRFLELQNGHQSAPSSIEL